MHAGSDDHREEDPDLDAILLFDRDTASCALADLVFLPPPNLVVRPGVVRKTYDPPT
jgi:hypothetical protein